MTTLLDRPVRQGNIEARVEDLAARLADDVRTKADYIVDTRELQVHTSEGSMQMAVRPLDANGQPGTTVMEWPVGDFAHGQLAERLDVPVKYYRRLLGAHPDLLDINVNTLLDREPNRRMLRTLRGEVRAFLSDRYRRRDNWDLVDAVLPLLYGDPRTDSPPEIPGAQLVACNLSDSKLLMKWEFTNLEYVVPRPPSDGSHTIYAPDKADIIHAGILIQNSEVGAGALHVAPYTVRLLCSNGMTHTAYGQRQYHVGKQVREADDLAYTIYSDDTLRADDKAFWLKVQDVVRAASGDVVFKQIVDRYSELAGLPRLERPVEAMRALGKTHGLSIDDQNGILGHLVQWGDSTPWGVVNAITRYAQDVDDYERAHELECLGGALTEAPLHTWTQLAQV